MLTKLTALPPLAGSRVHFVGVKGTGMCALAEIFARQGVRLTGSDVADVFYTDAILCDIGVTPTPFDSVNVKRDLDFLVYSAAYAPESNAELAEAERRRIPAGSYTQVLGLLSAAAWSVGIAGVHGKTTTAGMTGTVLAALGLSAATLAGSAIASFGGRSTRFSGDGTTGSGTTGAPRFFVAETCEYRRHFLDFHPRAIVLTSVESDHQDCFPTYADIRSAFVDYCASLPVGGTLIYCADHPGAVETVALVTATRPDLRLLPYGESATGTLRVTIGETREDAMFRHGETRRPAIQTTFTGGPGMGGARSPPHSHECKPPLLRGGGGRGGPLGRRLVRLSNHRAKFFHFFFANPLDLFFADMLYLPP
jgi:UDP-N-acetylmuramate--alanine ligase